MFGLARVLEYGGVQLSWHSRRVAALTVSFARWYGLEDQTVRLIYQGALLHDLGKIAIPEAILLKPTQLTQDELRCIQMHPVYGYEWLASFGCARQVLTIPYGHHEKWDGSGYPRRLQGEDIPLEARLCALADVWDALHSGRCYRQAWERWRVVEYFEEQAGRHFDPCLTTAFIRFVTGGAKGASCFELEDWMVDDLYPLTW